MEEFFYEPVIDYSGFAGMDFRTDNEYSNSMGLSRAVLFQAKRYWIKIGAVFPGLDYRVKTLDFKRAYSQIF